jgi:CheY-like chemotaxis protein
LVARTIHVLLVNDFPDEREMYAEWFQHKGYITLQAASADDACRLAVELHPDVIVTDINLNGDTDGLWLTHALKTDAATSAMPVIILTGRAFDRDRLEAARAGCDRFLTKPCVPDVLEHAVDELLEHHV